MLARGDGRSAGCGYRFFDESGDLLALRADMTVPIARLVASRFAGAEDAGAPLLPGQRLPRGAPPARPDARVHPGRGRADRRPGAAGHGRGDRGAGGGARRGRARPRRDRPRRRRPLPPAARRVGVEGEARDSILERLATHDLVGLEAELSAVEGIGDEQCATCVALSQLRGGREVLDEARALGGAAVERATARIGETFEALERARRRRPGPDRPRPAARPRLLQRRDPRGLRPGARPRARRRRPLRRPAQALRRSTCPRPASPSTWSASTSPRWRRSGASGAEPDERRRRHGRHQGRAGR